VRKTRRRAGCRIITGGSVLLAGLAMCVPAGAATLKPYHHYDGVRYDDWQAVYVAGAEANHVTLGGQGGRIYVLRDPNVPITTPPLEPPYVSKDPWDTIYFVTGLGETAPFRTSFNCTAPRGKGQGLCIATPGTRCNDGGCYTRTDTRFSRAVVSLGSGNDAATLLQGSSMVSVIGGAGNDTLDTRNGANDIVDCGDGVDVVAADPADGVFANCEVVTRGR
jgi:Ca2+-binding RTX toxin-like protein